MGLFQQRPEQHNDEWAGLPSEPLKPQGFAEALPEEQTVAAASLDPAGEGVTSISIPIPATPDTVEPGEEDTQRE
ncbi:hypothetical protein [Microbacterium sp. YY-01]|uniref:hypothetical protein n=1 Tax=Microbacterium sp. YY-01 TaxID=3421634 RepID=UPI003D16C60A